MVESCESDVPMQVRGTHGGKKAVRTPDNRADLGGWWRWCVYILFGLLLFPCETINKGAEVLEV